MACADQGVPTAGNAAGNTMNWLNLTGAPMQPSLVDYGYVEWIIRISHTNALGPLDPWLILRPPELEETARYCMVALLKPETQHGGGVSGPGVELA
jgi:hypothetical protein